VSSRGQIDAHIGRAQLAMEAQRTHFHGPSLLVLQSDDVDSAQYISPAFTMGIPLDIALGYLQGKNHFYRTHFAI
jgi:hypothetical protein